MKAVFLLTAAAAAFAQNPVTVTKQPAPDKALIIEVTVPASRAAVWQALTTSAGLSTWLWKSGAEWDKAYDYLAQGNAELLEMLRRRFVSGPIDWAKEWGK